MLVSFQLVLYYFVYCMCVYIFYMCVCVFICTPVWKNHFAKYCDLKFLINQSTIHCCPIYSSLQYVQNHTQSRAESCVKGVACATFIKHHNYYLLCRRKKKIMKDQSEHHGIVDECNQNILWLSGVVHLVLLDLTAGKQQADGIHANLENFKIHCTSKLSTFCFV